MLNIKPVLYFLFCFFLVLGPKIGYIDSSLFSIVLLPFIVRSPLKIYKAFYWLTFLLIVLICYQAFVQFGNRLFDFEAMARLVRALLTTLLVGLVFNEIGLYENRHLFRSLLLVLIAHALIIIVAANIPTINEFLSAVSGNDRVRDYRASGLLAGFDIAGLLCCIGLAMIYFRESLNESNYINVVYSILLLCGCYYTSRVSMVIGILIFLSYGYGKFIVSRKLILNRISIATIFMIVGFLFLWKVITIIEVTFSLGVVDVDTSIISDITSRHAAQDTDYFLWTHMLFLPESFWHIIFGTGVNPLESDVGYVQEIFRYGIIGMLIALSAHVYFILRTTGGCTSNVRKFKQSRLINFLFFSMLVLSLKNNYIFVRGIYPVFLILVTSVANELRNRGAQQQN